MNTAHNVGHDASAHPSPEEPIDPALMVDRGNPAVRTVRPVAARMTQVLATGVFAVLGGGLLVWYTAHAWRRPQVSRTRAQAVTQQKAKGEMVLPALGDLSSLRRAVADRRAGLDRAAAETAASPEIPSTGLASAAMPPAGVPPAGVLLPSAAAAATAVTSSGSVLAPAAAAGGRAARVGPRALLGPVFSDGRDTVPAAVAPPRAAPAPPSSMSAPGEVPGSAEASDISSARVPPAGAAGLPPAGASSREMMLPRGSVLDCTLETAIDSTLPGMTTCLIAVEVFGEDGQVVVLPRGTQLVGETRGSLRAGQARIAVIWHSARRPDGVVVALESPGTDALGRAGLSGTVDRQFADRFGAAVLLSVVDGAIAAGVASQQRGGSSVVVTPAGSEAVMTEMLKETQGVGPKLVIAQGARLAVLVAKDLDLSAVRPPGRPHGVGEDAGGSAHGRAE